MPFECKVCGATEDTAEFYASIGNKCKECHKAHVRQHRADMAEHYRECDRQRYQNDPRVKARHRRYQKTEAGKASLRKARQKWMENNADKRAAHVLLGNAVRDGKIKKGPCEVCGSTENVHGHHDDYTKPLEVRWLCALHHAREHA